MVIKNPLFLLLMVSLLDAREPQWFKSPKPNPNGFYGLGWGENIKSAKANALMDLSTSIQSSIQSVFSSEDKRVDDSLFSSAMQNISINTRKLALSNLFIAQSECENGVCYVRVEISKQSLLSELRSEIMLKLEEFNSLQSPFDYGYKKDVLFPELLKDFSLFSSLGGVGIEIPKSVGSKPSFNLIFQYDGDFSKIFKSILEKTIKDNITKYGNISAHSKWQIIIGIIEENKGVAIEISAKYLEKEIHSASIFDTQKRNISNSFFAKRLGVQTYKKINQWGKNQEVF